MAQTTGGPLPVTAAFTRPGQAVARWLRGEIRTTPGRLRLWSIVVLIVTALTALLGVNALGARRRVAADLRNDRAAFLFDTQGLHTALLKADAESANAFLAGGIEPADRRKGYEDAVADAAARLATAAQRADTADARVSIGKISQLLPVYTGLIESARANNRQGFPAGGAYLRAASKKLRAEIVPLVEDVEQIALDRFRAKYADLSGGAAVALASLMVGLVLLLAWLQLWLFRRTNRVLNPPLVAATVLVVVSLVSVLGTMARQRVDARDAVREGFRPALLSAEARVQGTERRRHGHGLLF